MFKLLLLIGIFVLVCDTTQGNLRPVEETSVTDPEETDATSDYTEESSPETDATENETDASSETTRKIITSWPPTTTTTASTIIINPTSYPPYTNTSETVPTTRPTTTPDYRTTTPTITTTYKFPPTRGPPPLPPYPICCGRNEFYLGVGIAPYCDTVCSDIGKRCKIRYDKAEPCGCFCKPGYCRDSDNKCILTSDANIWCHFTNDEL